MTRLLLSALPADTAAQDAAALAAAVSDLGALATVMVCATVVLVFVARGSFAWLTAREERLKAQPDPQRKSTPPGGTAIPVATLHADVRQLEERVRAVEQQMAGHRVAVDSLQDELRRDLGAVRQSQERMTDALAELSERVAALTAQVASAIHGPAHFGQPKTGG